MNGPRRDLRGFQTFPLVTSLVGLQLSPANAHVLGLLEATCAASLLDWKSQGQSVTREAITQTLSRPAFTRGVLPKLDDPHEHFFTDMLTYHGGNHIVFPGPTLGGTRPLSAVVSALESEPDTYDQAFLDRARSLVSGVLTLSNAVANRAGLAGRTGPEGWHYADRHRPARHPLITVPPDESFDVLATACMFPAGVLTEMFTPDERTAVEQHLGSTLVTLQRAVQRSPTDALTQTPLLILEDGWVLLAPHALLAATTRALLRNVRRAGQEEIFDVQHAQSQNLLIRLAMARLGCEPVHCAEESDSTDTCWYLLDTDKVVGVTTRLQPAAAVDTTRPLGDWHPNLPPHPPQPPFPADEVKVLHLLLLGDLGDGFRLQLPPAWSPPQVLAMRPDDLETLAAAHRNDPTLLWRLQRSRVALRQHLRLHFDNPIDELALLSKWHFARHFPLPHDSALVINGEIGGDWRRAVHARRDKHGVPWIDGQTLIPVERNDHMPPTLYAPLLPIWSLEHVLVEQGRHLIWVLDRRGHDRRVALDAPSHAVGDPDVRKLDQTLPFFVQGAAVWLTHLLPHLQLDGDVSGEGHPVALLIGVTTHGPPCHAVSKAREQEIHLTLAPPFLTLLSYPDNRAERVLVRVLAQSLLNLHGQVTTPAILDHLVETVAPLGDKRLIMHVLGVDTELDHRGLLPVRYLRPDDQHEWAVQAGRHLARRNRWAPGPLPTVTSQVAIDANDFLYAELQRRLEALDGEQLLPFLLAHYEAVRYDQAHLMTSRLSREMTFGAQAIPFHEAAEATSVALRFLLELMAARLPTGSALPSLMGLDDLMGLAVMITHYGQVGDALQYRVGEVSARLDGDGALLMDASDYRRAMQSLRALALHEGARRANQERYEKADLPDVLSAPDVEPPEDPHVPALMNEACHALYGLTLQDLMRFMNGALNIGDDHEGGVVMLPLQAFMTAMQADTSWAEDRIELALNALSLQERPDFLTPPAGFARSEVLPWQFNRALSLVRRPLIRTTLHGQPYVVWGNRALASSQKYWMEDQIMMGRLNRAGPAVDPKRVARAMQALNTFRGEIFNRNVADQLRESGFHVLENVNRFGKLKMLEGGDALGDIDVFAWCPQRRRILLLECKAYAPARTPLELHAQLQEFLHGKQRAGKAPERPLMAKHLRRSQFIRIHLSDVLAHLGVADQGLKWVVQPAYVMSNLPSELLQQKAPFPVLHLNNLSNLIDGTYKD